MNNEKQRSKTTSHAPNLLIFSEERGALLLHNSCTAKCQVDFKTFFQSFISITVNTPIMPNNQANRVKNNIDNAATVSGSPGSQGPEGPKTKAMLKGWSSLAQSSSASKAQERQIKASDTFNAFKKAAQEKADRERALQEQQESQRMKKAAEERQRKQEENERRREKEEEEALEQARRAMMCKSNENSNQGQNHFEKDSAEVQAEAEEAEKAEKARERQRQREQERRRREAKANQIDMNMQSDLMAAFEENII